MGKVIVAELSQDELARQWSEQLLHGKSSALDKFLRRPSEIDAAGITAGARILAGQEAKYRHGVAVAVYALLQSRSVNSGAQLGDMLGVHRSRISQLKQEGETIAKLGLPEGWKASVSASDVQALTQGKGAAQLREIVALSVPVADKRAKVAALVDEARAAAEAAAVQRAAEAAERKAQREAHAGTDTPTEGAEGVTETIPVWDKTRGGSAVAEFVAAGSYLRMFWDKLTPEQQNTVSAEFAEWQHADQ